MSDAEKVDPSHPDPLAEVEELKERLHAVSRESASAVRRRRMEQELKPFQAQLIRLQHYLEETGKGMIVIFEGRDAAGKGGTIRRIVRYMNEKHYRLVALGKPTDEERSQWYFQRYVKQFPRGGEIVLFDRSWYNRAMVEPVFGFCTPQQYRNFMAGVNEFERDIVRQGVILLKLYFSVSKAVQSYRFERRKNDPLRQWKLSEVDLQAQDRWDDFTNMKYTMLRHTNTPQAPWIIIRSDDKHQARLNAIKVLLQSGPLDLDPGFDYQPDPNIVVSVGQELATMEALRSDLSDLFHKTMAEVSEAV
ncbi:MAG: polyphosphate kinase 2 [Magnetococcales bacterium]|nr:polyphosphate kinase 2 [Magnetococcales bacterium]MBF0155834.1 polyphosphate kinase 2 [Magnetococcales bacterium]